MNISTVALPQAGEGADKDAITQQRLLVEALCRNCCDDLSSEELFVLESDPGVRQLMYDHKAAGCQDLPCSTDVCNTR